MNRVSMPIWESDLRTVLAVSLGSIYERCTPVLPIQRQVIKLVNNILRGETPFDKHSQTFPNVFINDVEYS